MGRSVLDSLGEEVTGIVAPVSLCMFLTVALVGGAAEGLGQGRLAATTRSAAGLRALGTWHLSAACPPACSAHPERLPVRPPHLTGAAAQP